MTRRGIRVLAGLCLLATVSLWSAGSQAQSFPSQAIRIVHPYPAGASDAIIRSLADRLKGAWGVPIVVDPKPGASETLAANEVAHARPDGYTWFIGTESTYVNNPYLFRKLPYEVGDLMPVSELFVANYALIVRGDLPVTSLAAFVDLARQSKPQLKYGTIGVGTGPHLAMESALAALGIPGVALHVPYRTPSQAAQDLVGGNIDVVMSPQPFALPFVAGGRMKVLAIGGARRTRELPGTPTFAELGFPAIAYRTSFGLAVPKGVPNDVVQKIASAMRAALADPELEEKLLRPSGFERVASEPDAFSQVLLERRRDARRLIDGLGIRLD